MLDQTKVQEFAQQVIADLGAAHASALTLVGHRLGLFRAMRGAGGVLPEELARRAGVRERYAREWLNAQAAGGYVTYDPSSSRYTLPDEHAYVLADPDSAIHLAPAFEVTAAMWAGNERLQKAFVSGNGIGWHEHEPGLFCGTEAFFRNGYRAHLTSEWIPALDGVAEKLARGARVADVGCGHGASTIVMAQAYPASRFCGFDYHEESVRIARERAKEAGVEDRVTFEVASAKDYPATEYDLICYFDALHDMGDPVGAAIHARHAVAPDGTILLVEPFAGDRVEDNLNPVGRVYYSASTAICTPASLSQEVGLGLGAQAGPRRLSGVMHEAGFRSVRVAASTPFNLIIEARA